MDIMRILALTIFAATIVTLVMALVSYSAFKLRERRKPRLIDGVVLTGPQRGVREQENQFFKKYVLPPEEVGERDA